MTEPTGAHLSLLHNPTAHAIRDALIAHGPMTAQELEPIVGETPQTLHRFLVAMRVKGCILQAAKAKQRTRTGRRSIVYAHNPDAPALPERMTRDEWNAASRLLAKKRQPSLVSTKTKSMQRERQRARIAEDLKGYQGQVRKLPPPKLPFRPIQQAIGAGVVRRDS